MDTPSGVGLWGAIASSLFNFFTGNLISNAFSNSTAAQNYNHPDWYKDRNGTVQYDPNVQSQADLGNRGTYLGKETLIFENETFQWGYANGDKGGIPLSDVTVSGSIPKKFHSFYWPNIRQGQGFWSNEMYSRIRDGKP